MNIKILLPSIIMFLCLATISTAADLPANPWQKSDSRNNNTITLTPPLLSESLGSNPWKKNTSATSSEGYRITVPQQYEDDSYPNTTDTIIINQRRNTGGVGKVKGYTLQTLPAGSTSTKNNTSMFGNLQKTKPSVSPSNVTPEMPDFNTDFNLDNEYKKIKQQGTNKLHSFTSPITGTFHKWWDAVKQTGQDLMK